MLYYIRKILNDKSGNIKNVKNIPRIFIDTDIHSGSFIPVSKDTLHYLVKVMRRRDCLCFNAGNEYKASLSEDTKHLLVGEKTDHEDPSNNITLYFAPIKHIDELINMATQMGVKALQPVMTEHVTARHINWERAKKIAIEASEQSNRNSIPEILPIKNFSELDFTEMYFADERTAYNKSFNSVAKGAKKILIGPEGGFSNKEFETLDSLGCKGINLSKTILRTELAAAIAISKVEE